MSDSGWNTIDSDAAVFSELVEKLLVADCEINELYAIDQASLAELDPVHGLIFLFKYGAVDRNNTGLPLHGDYQYLYAERGIFFAQQTIHNACATNAVLNILLNSSVDIGPKLSAFKEFVLSFPPDLVGEAISNCDLIRITHNSFSPPAALDLGNKPDRSKEQDYKTDGVFHFISYIFKNGHIYELDGLKAAPIEHCACRDTQDFYTKLPLVVQQRIALYPADELRFSLLAVTNNKLEHYRRLNDFSAVAAQENKRALWARENELRRHGYTGLIVELIKQVSATMDDDQWEALLANARSESQAALLRQYTLRS